MRGGAGLQRAHGLLTLALTTLCFIKPATSQIGKYLKYMHFDKAINWIGGSTEQDR